MKAKQEKKKRKKERLTLKSHMGECVVRQYGKYPIPEWDESRDSSYFLPLFLCFSLFLLLYSSVDVMFHLLLLFFPFLFCCLIHVNNLGVATYYARPSFFFSSLHAFLFVVLARFKPGIQLWFSLLHRFCLFMTPL